MNQSNSISLKIASGILLSLIIAGVSYGFIKFIFLPFIKIAGISLIITLMLFYLLDPVIAWLERKGIERDKSVKMIFLSSMVIFILIAVITLPGIAKKGASFMFEKGSIKEEILSGIEKASTPLEKFIPKQVVMEKTVRIIEDMQKSFFENLPSIINQISYIIILVPFMSYFILVGKRKLLNRFLEFVPNRYFEITLHLIHRINLQWGVYIRGKILESLILSAVIILFLLPVRPPYLILQALIAGFMNIIPYIGSIIGGIPGVIIAVSHFKAGVVLYVIFVYFVVAQIIVDEIILTPTLLAKISDLHPLTVLIVLFIGEEIGGIIGMIVCIPVAILLKIVILEAYYFFKYQGETPPEIY